jgi:GT2 family glycosyltransferase
MNSIPVIGTAIVNGPHWIKRLIESIDYPVDNFVIFDNNGRGQIAQELDNLAKITYQFIENVTVCHMPANIGCSGAWNMIIKCFMNAPYWIISNHDVAYMPGFLEEMITKAEADPEAGIVHGHPGDYGIGAWDVFLIKDWTVKKLGLFDENLYPAYGEDSDYIMRIKNSGLKRILHLDHTYYHGETTDYYTSGAQTKRCEPWLNDKLNEVNFINFEYLNKKWSPGWRQVSPYPTPFNNPAMPITTTTYDLEFVRRKHLGF